MAKTPTSRAADPRTGATLAELLVVLAILGLVIGLVAPRLGAGLSGADARLAARQTAQLMAEARARALAHGQDRRVVIDLQARTVRLEPDGVTRRLPQDVAITAEVAENESAAGLAGVRFFAEGGATGAAIQFSADQRSFTTRVSWITGAAHVEPTR